MVFVGDRGMITKARIEALKEHGGYGWVSALRALEIKKLLRDGPSAHRRRKARDRFDRAAPVDYLRTLDGTISTSTPKRR